MPTTTRSAKSTPVRKRSSSLRPPVARKAGWTDLDVRAVDTVRVLAADAVQKVGNGHPGTAMSLAPAAYLLYQNVMRHDPSDSALARPRPVRAVVRPLEPDPVHPALPVRLRARARRPQGAAHVGLADPRPPGGPPHQRRRDHHRPAGLGPGLRGRHGDGPAASAGPVRPGRQAGHQPLRPPHLGARVGRRHHGGRLARGVRPGRPPGARQPHGDLRPEHHLDRGQDRDLVLRGRGPALRGLRLERRDHRLARRRHERWLRRERRPAAGRAGPQPHLAQAHLRRAPHDHRLAGTHQAGHRQVARLGPRRPRDRRHQGAARLRPQEDLRGPAGHC